MNTKPNLLRVILAITPFCAFAQTQPADSTNASSSKEEAVVLPEFTVSDKHADPYRAVDAMSAARIRSSLLDTPVTVNVITKDFMQDIGANSILDASRYFAGISEGRLAGTNGISDRHLSRGFENSGRTVDNMSTAYQAQINPELIERVEIVKGPNAILAPTGSPGGSLNVITKSPQFTQSYAVVAAIGRYSADKGTIDATGPITKSVAYRIVSSYMDAPTFAHGAHQKSFDVNPSLLFKIGDKTTIKIKGNFVDWNAKGNAAVPAGISLSPNITGGAVVSYSPSVLAPGSAYDDYNMQPSWAIRSDKVNAIAAELVTAITDKINMRFAASTNEDTFKEDDVFGGNSNGGDSFYDPYTGVFTPLMKWSLDATSGKYVPAVAAWPDPAKSDIYADLTVTKYYDTMFQHDFAGRWDFNGVTVSPIAGWMYQDRHGTNWERQKYLGVYNLNLFPRPTFPHPARSEYDLRDTDINEIKKLFETYVYSQFGFLDQRILTTVGWARVNVDNKTTDYNNNGSVSTLKGGHNTFAASVLGKIAPNVSLYYGYSSNAQATDAGRGAPPRWRDGKQHEFGLKTEFLDKRISASVAYFRINQTNISTPNPYRQLDPTQPGVLFQDITNNGVEFEVVGGVTKNLSIVANFTNMHYRDTLGRRVRNVPDDMANLLANYHVTKELSFFIGLQHTGENPVETAPNSAAPLGVIKQVSAYLAPFTVINAGGQYRVGNLRINLDVDNVLNTKALYEPSGRGSVSGLPYINPKLTVRYEF